ncbi:MAG: phosphoglucosamine mutase [Defluviitaleaceae bacterium]|nr:phosphoglucosamine mutase [Defluviitaleaceae bacterium]
MGKLFGTDGVRGLANSEITPELAFALGKAGAYVLTKHTKGAPKILLGMDPRRSSPMLAAALTAGMCSMGADVYNAGVIPTPGVAYVVRKGYDAGVMISASHNPYQDNGIKFFNSQGYKLDDSLEQEITAIFKGGLDSLPRPTHGGVGEAFDDADALGMYIEFLRNVVKRKDFSGMKIVLDCANGATCKAAAKVFEPLGADVKIIHNNPDGFNINANCGSTHMNSLVESVKAHSADIGIAFDGDGDRCLLVDGNGRFVDGDEILSICANYMRERGKLANDTIVATVMSNLGLKLMGEKLNINILQTGVGDRYVLEEMLASGYNLGGEQSGHVIFLDESTTGDGILTALKLLCALAHWGKTLAQANTFMEKLPQVLVNAKVANDKKRAYADNAEIVREIAELEKLFAGEGRVLIRPSGTEPKVRVMIEGRDQQQLETEAKRIAALIEELFG